MLLLAWILCRAIPCSAVISCMVWGKAHVVRVCWLVIKNNQSARNICRDRLAEDLHPFLFYFFYIKGKDKNPNEPPPDKPGGGC